MCCPPPELSLLRISNLTQEQQAFRAAQARKAAALLKAIAATQIVQSTGNVADYPVLNKLLKERAAARKQGTLP